MPYIIDGHNLIGHMADIHLNDPDDELMLINKLQSFLRKNEKRAFLYFDRRAPGSKANYSIGRLRIKFVAHPRTADAAIRSKLRELNKEAKNYTVVSSDQEIMNFGRSKGARVLFSETFAEQLIAAPISATIDDKPEQELSPDELTYWENLFQGSSEDKS